MPNVCSSRKNICDRILTTFQVLSSLTHNAVIENRFDDASYYFFLLSVEHLRMVKNKEARMYTTLTVFIGGSRRSAIVRENRQRDCLSANDLGKKSLLIFEYRCEVHCLVIKLLNCASTKIDWCCARWRQKKGHRALRQPSSGQRNLVVGEVVRQIPSFSCNLPFFPIELTAEEKKNLDLYKKYTNLAEIYYCYHIIHNYTVRIPKQSPK